MLRHSPFLTLYVDIRNFLLCGNVSLSVPNVARYEIGLNVISLLVA